MKIFVIAIAFIIALCTSALSDIIYFKDGGEVEGIVKEEADGFVVIDIGFGTMSVREDEIDHIKEASAEKLEQLKRRKIGYEIERGEWAPSGYEYIKTLYVKAKDDKSALQEARRDSKLLKSKIHEGESRVSKLLDTLDKESRGLKAVDPKKDVKKYNEIVAEMNSLNADLNKVNNEINVLHEEEKQLNTKSAKLASRYRSNFQLFLHVLEKKRGDMDESEITADELYYFQTMDNKASEMEDDFKKDVAEYTPEGSQIIVDVILEENVTARLIVDTGASIVIISRNIASRLGIKDKDINTEIKIVMADGSEVEAKPVILKSVKVGDAEVKNVQAAILDGKNIGGADGLLGMSFLSNFVIKVDSASNQLILEKVL